MSSFKVKCNLPCGEQIYVNEINNDIYIALHKFVLNEDYIGFYKTLDNLIAETYQNIHTLSILDKFYIYISLYCYCIKSYLELQTDSLDTFMMSGAQQVNLSDSLDSFSSISSQSKLLKLNSKIGEITLEYSVPTSFELVKEKIVFNPITSIKKIYKDDISYILLKESDYKTVEDTIFTTENYYKLIKEIYNNFNTKIILVKDKIELSLLDHFTYEYFAKSFFCGDLKYIFSCMFLCTTELKMPPSEFKALTPIDSEILIIEYIKKRKEEEKIREKQNFDQNLLEL